MGRREGLEQPVKVVGSFESRADVKSPINGDRIARTATERRKKIGKRSAVCYWQAKRFSFRPSRNTRRVEDKISPGRDPSSRGRRGQHLDRALSRGRDGISSSVEPGNNRNGGRSPRAPITDDHCNSRNRWKNRVRFRARILRGNSASAFPRVTLYPPSLNPLVDQNPSFTDGYPK